MSFTLQNLVWTWSIVVLRRKILRRLPIWRVQNIIYWGSLDDHHGGIWSSESGKKWDFSVLLFLVLARKAYNLKRNFCSLGVVPVFASFFLPLIVNTNKKIRIGYVLKSAYVGTLFSRRNSENSSHTLAHTHAYPCTPAHTRALPPTPEHTCAYPPTPMHTRAHPYTLAHTRAHPHTPAHTPHIPADALNLINHMKLHVNGNN